MRVANQLKIQTSSAKLANMTASAFRGVQLPSTTSVRGNSIEMINTTSARRSTKVAASRPGSSVVRVMANGDKQVVAITGATGLVGSRLVSKLASEGHQIRVLTRNAEAAKGKFRGLPNVTCYGTDKWAEAINGSTAVVNLAGEPIANRWTPELKAEIKRSRVNATKRVVQAINALPAGQRPKVIVSSSAVGFYGSSDTATFDESSPSGRDYLAEICREWEGAANEAAVDRKVIVRTGIVLAREGGALGRMLPVFQLFAGGPLGSGRQWFSWIHRDDLVNLMVEAVKNKAYSGVVNGTAPQPVRMSEMCSTLGSILGRPSWLPVPDFALQTLLGEGAQVVLDGQKVLPTRTQQLGFKYKYNNIRDALRNLV